MKIDEEDVVAVLNLPRDPRKVLDTSKGGDNYEYYELVQEWKGRWGGVPTNAVIEDNLVKRNDAGVNFERDFIVFVVSSFLYGHKNTKCKFKVLKSLKDVEKIKDYNWCQYTIKALVESQIKWRVKRTESFYFEPLTLLVLCYLDRTEYMYSEPRVFPVIKNWDTDKIKIRSDMEISGDEFGNVRVHDHLNIPLEQKVEDEDSQQKSNCDN
ncbi:OLC1v1013039C1 [Oldenlandia corymbosa var. corymbosa]|uniref:OLC1v1013039C1 n=1 Tax=Oldenlandia corymbosa var. corymbosa TaxID=529605 RepID=A0AAV1E0Y5_OLDCO|nr:OLC1v1013039C1 [Oldenlandia corymbosa var. corymbosa]